LIAAASITLTPTGGATRSFSWCVGCGEFGTSELLLNVLLFVPLGLLLACRHRTMSVRGIVWRALAVGGVLSLLIEGTQWLLVPGRTSALGDLLANSLGAALGALLIMHRATLVAPQGRARVMWLATWTTAVVALLAFGIWSSTPWLPNGRWFLQRTPVRPWSDRYTGVLTFAGIGATNLPADRIRDTSLITAVRRGEQAVVVVEKPGIASARLSYVVRLVEADGSHELLSLARDADDAVVYTLTNSARARSGRIGVLLPSRYTKTGGRTVGWEIFPATQTALLRNRAPDTADVVTLAAPSVLRGWTALLPGQVALSLRTIAIMDLLWGALLAGPLLLSLSTQRSGVMENRSGSR
jgi:hypothetical protein